jgi:hypothetical protein
VVHQIAASAPVCTIVNSRNLRIIENNQGITIANFFFAQLSIAILID